MKRYTILILEDDVLTSVTMAKALRTEVPDADLMRAQSLFEARLLLSTFDIDFFVIDVNLPDGCGVDFILDVLSRNPAAGLAVVTIEALPQHRDRATSFGALFFLEKPVSPRNLGHIIRTHRASGESDLRGSDTSFTASLSRLSAMDVVQLKCLARATVRLDFAQTGGRNGSIYLVDGQIIHAETAERAGALTSAGIHALAEILAWRGGRIEEVRGCELPAPTIQGDWQSLLLTAAHMTDESNPVAA